MSVDTAKVGQLTRTAYLSGLSATEWHDAIIDLCSTFSDDLELVAPSVCDTILLLLTSFPRDNTLMEYLRIAILESRIPVHLWHAVAAFFKQVHTGIHDPSTLDMLCRLILNLHYATNSPPLGSLVPFTELPTGLVNLVTDCLYLLRNSYDFPTSPFHTLTASASDLLILLLACIGDLSSVPTPQVTMALSHVHELLQVVTLEENLRSALDSFLLTLGMLLGDSTRQVEDAEMYTNFQMTPGRQDGAGPNPSLDLLSVSLIINRLVSSRATQSGSGCESVAVATLLAWYRVSYQVLAVFYAHVILSAMSCLAQEPDSSQAFLWRSFIFARIPVLLRKLRDRLTLEGGLESEQADISTSMQSAIVQVLARQDLVDQCGRGMSISNRSSNRETMEEGNAMAVTFRYELLSGMVTSGLLDYAAVQELVPGIRADSQSKIAMDLQESGTDIDVFIETKFSPDVTLEDSMTFFDRYIGDYRSHAVISEALCDSFIRSCTAANVERLGRICKVLTDGERVLDIISLHAPLHDMIAHALACLQNYDLTTVGDPQTAVSHIGEVVIFLQSVAARFRITCTTFHLDNRVLHLDTLCLTSVVYLPDTLSPEDKSILDAWRKAIFDPSSEGIDDDILRSTKPKTLLRLSATLFSAAVASCIAQRIDEDALRNGVSYYMGPLLNWTLVGVVQALFEELDRASYRSPRHIAVLQAILTDKNCPKVVIRIVRQQLVRLCTDPKVLEPDVFPTMNTLIAHVLPGFPPTFPKEEQSAFILQPRNMIRYALASATTNRVPTLDVDRCLAMIKTRTFLDYLWQELLATASVGKVEVCRRFATHLLAPTSPLGSSSSSRTPPLLPIFLHAYLPTLLLSIDSHGPADQTLSIQLLCTIIVSTLTFSVNFERALLKSSDGLSRVHNLPSAGMARRLRLDLRKAKSPSALALFQKLSASSTFVATFPGL